MNANDALLAVQALVAENCELRQDLRDCQEQLEAVMLIVRPPAIAPIAEVPVRDVTHIEMDVDLA